MHRPQPLDTLELGRRTAWEVRKLDLRSPAAELGVSRAARYRWVGDRDVDGQPEPSLPGDALACAALRIDESDSYLRVLTGQDCDPDLAHRVLMLLMPARSPVRRAGSGRAPTAESGSTAKGRRR